MITVNIKKNASLERYNTFGIDVQCKELVRIRSEKELIEYIGSYEGNSFILGGGSNILLAGNIEMPVLKNEIKGIEILEETESMVLIQVGGGEVWHDLVLWAVDHGYGGLENLSLIPGTVGAAPIQNIGAYGVEQCDTFQSLMAVEMSSGKLITFHSEQCEFGYRDSYFKKEGKGKYFITSVIYQLKKKSTLNISYGAIQSVLESTGIDEPTIKDVSNAVIEIRSGKLPDPAVIGNSGSFFKNPVVSSSQFNQILEGREHVVHYHLDDGNVKIPAGWLIDQCGWKGKQKGNVGCYEKQALVLVNHGGATGDEVWSFAKEIQKDVFEKWGIMLEPEVNVIGG